MENGNSSDSSFWSSSSSDTEEEMSSSSASASLSTSSSPGPSSQNTTENITIESINQKPVQTVSSKEENINDEKKINIVESTVKIPEKPDLNEKKETVESTILIPTPNQPIEKLDKQNENKPNNESEIIKKNNHDLKKEKKRREKKLKRITTLISNKDDSEKMYKNSKGHRVCQSCGQMGHYSKTCRSILFENTPALEVLMLENQKMEIESMNNHQKIPNEHDQNDGITELGSILNKKKVLEERERKISARLIKIEKEKETMTSDLVNIKKRRLELEDETRVAYVKIGQKLNINTEKKE